MSHTAASFRFFGKRWVDHPCSTNQNLMIGLGTQNTAGPSPVCMDSAGPQGHALVDENKNGLLQETLLFYGERRLRYCSQRGDTAGRPPVSTVDGIRLG